MLNYYALLFFANIYNILCVDFKNYTPVKNRTLAEFYATFPSSFSTMCVLLCEQSPECLSVSYHELSLTCLFHAKHPVQTDAILTISAGFSLFYSYECPAGLYKLGDKCYFYSTFENSWENSQVYCNGIGGNLVKISNDDEQEFLAEISDKQYHENGIGHYWIGAYYNTTQAKFLWYDDTIVEYSGGWGPSQPNINQGCVDTILHYNWRWNDHINCASELQFICEKDIFID